MRSLSGSSVTTFLMFVPLLAVPLLAIFGIPEFSPVNASPSDDHNRVLKITDRDTATGQSEKHAPDDLFADIEKRAEFAADFKRLDNERRENPFAEPAGTSGKTAADSATTADTRAARLAGWKVDANRGRQTPVVRVAANSGQRRPIESAALNSDRNPFAGDASDRTDPTPARRERPASFADYMKARDTATPETPPARQTPATGAGAARQRVPAETKPATQSGAPLTWQEAARRLNALGISKYYLQPGRRQGQFHFSCIFTPHQGARVSHRFEAEDAEPLKAVGHVLTQIDAWLRKR